MSSECHHGQAVANSPAAVSAGNAPAVALFQKAHAKIVTLQRVDEQLLGLTDQRRKLLDEIRAVQSQINDEFDRVLRDAQDHPVPSIPDQAAKLRRHSPKETLRLEVAEAV
jgi:hypothetical protein